MAHKKKAHTKKMSKDHMKEYDSYSPGMLKKHMGDEKVLMKKKMIKKGARGY